MDSLRAPASGLIHKFLASILADPSELIFVVREGKIHISPYGSYSSRIANTYGRKPGSKTSLSLRSPAHALTLTPTCLLDCSFLADQLTELEEILSAKTVREKAIHDFLIRHPDMLRLFEPYSRIHPHVHLRDRKGTTLIPDFMCQIEDDQIWEIIELKRPSAIQLDGLIAERISSEIAHGVKQLLKYASFFEHNQNRGRLRDRYNGIDCFEPLLTLVIGREFPLQRRYQWSHMKAHWPNVNIISYDFMIQECRNTLNKIIGLQPRP
jgi:Shedu protein SduA, C-terminal